VINSSLLKGKIVANNYTQKTLAEKMNISENSLNAKINGKADFDLSQVILLCELLGINSPDEKCQIFLA